MKRIAIVIPTFNRKKEICDLLDQLLVQKKNLELEGIQILIIVVVDGSTDGTLDVLYEFRDK